LNLRRASAQATHDCFCSLVIKRDPANHGRTPGVAAMSRPIRAF
jgi:hypothetical protein